MKQTSSLHTAVITKGLRRGRPGPGPVIMSIIIWPMAGPCAVCRVSQELTTRAHTHNTRSVEFRDNSVSSGIFICHIMFQFRWLFDLPERANWFIWPTPLSSAQTGVYPMCSVQYQPGPGSGSLWLGHWMLSVERRVSDCHVVMSACHNDNMTASWPTCHGSDGPEIGSDCEQICRVMTRRLN